MCGIVGVLDRRTAHSDDELLHLVRSMGMPMEWRGPDAAGAWVDAGAGIAIGHRRLKVLDLSESAAQPMVSGDGRLVLSFNGEIYNFVEIRDNLVAAGHRFRGSGDTEVLLAAIQRWGVEATLERIDGMFAFAVWDRDARELVLARDRIGEKPLYYGRAGSAFVFASALDPLRVHPQFDVTLDREALLLFFRHKYVPAPWSIYQSIRKLPPGCLLRIGEDGAFGEPEPYWRYFDVVEAAQRNPFEGSFEDAVDELDRLLVQSVARRVVADVPVGAFLSGGIDSSTVVSVMAEGPQTVRTFTIGSSAADFDESGDARAIAAHLGAEHSELQVDGATALGVVPRLAQIYDEPFADSSQIPTYLVAQLARENVTVALSGDGGDELFGGYNRYSWLPAVWRRVERVPPPIRRAGARMINAIPPQGWDRFIRLAPPRVRPRQFGLKLAKVASIAPLASEHEMFHRLVSHWHNPADVVLQAQEPRTIHTDPARWPSSNGFVGQMMAIDTVTYLPDDILVKVDRATMAVSLEGRIPFLDREIVEFATSLPMSMKLHPSGNKAILRALLRRRVPSALVDRPKAGFGVPIEGWLRGSLKGWAEDLLFGTPAIREYIDVDPIREVWDEHQRHAANNAYTLWDALMFSSWLAERT
jgi:asparagine synthase (glutamine-hydrolysing)